LIHQVPQRLALGLVELILREVRLQKNLSDTRCVRNDNWGVDRRGIWVDRGCAARFTIY